MDYSKIVIVGLCAGRHDIPVSNYIFDEVRDVIDFNNLNKVAEKFVLDNCNTHIINGQGLSQEGYDDVPVWTGNPIHVVVTGLTACTTAVMWACACYGVDLTLWHFNRENGEYVPQRFNFGSNNNVATDEQIQHVKAMLN